MAASLSLQSAIVGTIVLASIVSVQQLPMISLPTPLPPLPRIPRPVVELVATGVAGAAGMLVPSTVVPRKMLVTPTTIPTKVQMITDDFAAYTGPTGPVGAVGPTDGVVGAIGDVSGALPVAPPPPPAPKPQTKAASEPVKAIRVSSGVQEAKILKRVIPTYPALARQARISGTVRLVAHIGRDGNIRELQVMGGHPLLVPAAVDAVRQWVYSPTRLNGEPVEVIAPIDVNFTLSN